MLETQIRQEKKTDGLFTSLIIFKREWTRPAEVRLQQISCSRCEVLKYPRYSFWRLSPSFRLLQSLVNKQLHSYKRLKSGGVPLFHTGYSSMSSVKGRAVLAKSRCSQMPHNPALFPYLNLLCFYTPCKTRLIVHSWAWAFISVHNVPTTTGHSLYNYCKHRAWLIWLTESLFLVPASSAHIHSAVHPNSNFPAVFL